MVKEPLVNASGLMAPIVPFRAGSKCKCNDNLLRLFLQRKYADGNIQVIRMTKTRYTITRTLHVSLSRKEQMDINNKARIHWACRRGMRELDISIMPFFEYEYETLSDEDKQLFIRLLECDDPDLFNWLMNHGEPADSALQRMVKLIQTRNRERGPVAI